MSNRKIHECPDCGTKFTYIVDRAVVGSKPEPKVTEKPPKPQPSLVLPMFIAIIIISLLIVLYYLYVSAAGN